MNNPLFHKETGDKETERRGKYLKKLFNSNALGPNKSLLGEKMSSSGHVASNLPINFLKQDDTERDLEKYI